MSLPPHFPQPPESLMPTHSNALRDQFAMAALPALIARHRAEVPWANVAPVAYAIANAMLIERDKGNG